VEDSLYLYGTDFMSNKDLSVYVGTRFPDVVIKWINDSSCTLKFESQEQAEQAYKTFSVRPAALRGASAETEEKVDERNFDTKLGWREALGFQHDTKGW
jgi:hypothetical protein